jgi:hypothetical protein
VTVVPKFTVRSDGPAPYRTKTSKRVSAQGVKTLRVLAQSLTTRTHAPQRSIRTCLLGAVAGDIISAMKRCAASPVALLAIAVFCGQAQPSTGTLVGRVSTLAKGGETKPARLAHVFLAWGPDQVRLQDDVEKAAAKRREDVKNGADSQEACALASVSIHEAVDGVSGIQTVNTDEDGNFEFAKIKAGTYTVVVMGSAAGYESVWSLTTTVTAGKNQKVKLSEPALACQ